MLAEALSIAIGAAQRLGLDFGGEKIKFGDNFKAAKSKPESKTQKVNRYMMLISTGKRQLKSELLNRI